MRDIPDKITLHNSISLCIIVCVSIIIGMMACGGTTHVNATSATTTSSNTTTEVTGTSTATTNATMEQTTTEKMASKQNNAGEATSTDDSSIQDKKREYEQVKKEADASKGTAGKLALEIKEMNLRIADEAKVIENAHNELSDIDKKIEDTERSLIEYEENMAVEKEHLYNSIRSEYEDGNRSLLSIFTNADRFSDIAERVEYSNSISSYLKNRMTAYQFMTEMVAKNRDSLNELKKQREEELVEYDKKKAMFKQSIDELTSLMKDAESRAESAGKLAKELETEITRMEAEERMLLIKNGYYQNTDYSDVTYTGDGTDYYYRTAYQYTDEELMLMAGIIEAEAGSSSYPGMIAVGSVIMNRVDSPKFDNTIEGVIYASGQFEPVRTGRLAAILARGPAVSCIVAAKDVLGGKRNVPNYYFKAAWYAAEHGIEGVNIGGNVFH